VEVTWPPKKLTPWFDAECLAAHQHVKAAERRLRQTHCNPDKCVWVEKMKMLQQLYSNKYGSYWRNEIDVNRSMVSTFTPMPMIHSCIYILAVTAQ